MVSTTRATSLRTELSRSGVPGVPRKYFDATTLVANIDHDLGTSMFFCSMCPPAVVLTECVDETRSALCPSGQFLEGYKVRKVVFCVTRVPL